MTQLDTRLEEQDMLLRILEYGPAKSKKTWWIGKAAEAGYNVLFLDGDNGWHILKQIKPEAQKRIQIIDARDKLGQPMFAAFLTSLLKRGKIVWDNKARKIENIKPNENCIAIDLNKFGQFDIVVIDSWTALARSLMLQYAKEHMIDLTDADDQDEDKWGYYRWAGTLINWLATQFTALDCHIAVIGHADQYEKRSKDGKSVIFSKRQVKSTSGPNAMQLPSQFSEILYFYPKGKAFKIDTFGTDEADGGSRLIAPGTYNWDALQFVDLIKVAGLPLPDKSHPLIDYSLPTTTTKRAQASGEAATAKPIVKPVAKPIAKVKTGGLKLTL